MATCIRTYEERVSACQDALLPMSPFNLSQWHAGVAMELVGVYEETVKGREGAAKFRSILDDRYLFCPVHLPSQHNDWHAGVAMEHVGMHAEMRRGNLTLFYIFLHADCGDSGRSWRLTTTR